MICPFACSNVKNAAREAFSRSHGTAPYLEIMQCIVVKRAILSDWRKRKIQGVFQKFPDFFRKKATNNYFCKIYLLD